MRILKRMEINIYWLYIIYKFNLFKINKMGSCVWILVRLGVKIVNLFYLFYILRFGLIEYDLCMSCDLVFVSRSSCLWMVLDI